MKKRNPKKLNRNIWRDWSYHFQTKFSHRISLVVSHDDANHEDYGDEEVANRCQNAKDQIVFRALIIDWQASNVRVHTLSS